MRVREKSLLIVVAVLAALGSGLYVLASSTVIGAFERLEDSNAREDMQRVLNAMEGVLHRLDASAGDWSNWDDTYRFAGDGNREFAEVNLTDRALVELDVDFLLIADRANRPVAELAVDLASGSRVDPPADLPAILARPGSPMAGLEPGEERSGILLLGGKAALVSAKPVLTSQGEGPSMGTLVFGRFLDQAAIESLEKTTRLGVSVSLPGDPSAPMDMDLAARSLVIGKTVVREIGDGDRIASYGMIADLSGKPAMLLRVDGPRDVLERGKQAMSTLLYSLALLGLVSLLVIMFLMDRLVLARIAGLSARAEEIARAGDMSARLQVKGRDEISRLAESTNLMLGRLEQAGNLDALTGLANRSRFQKEVSAVGKRPVGIVICDVDGLKLINDTLGHAAGDSLLVTASGIIGRCAGDAALASRIGGDEFAVLMPGAGEIAVGAMVDAIEREVAGHNASNPQVPVSISVGWASSGAVGSLSFDEIYKHADDAMYRSKLHRSRSARSNIVNALMKMMGEWDPATQDHSRRVYEYLEIIARAVGYRDRPIQDLELLGRFHDIGKIGVPESIRNKPAKLDPCESEFMHKHCEIGHRIAQSAPQLSHIADLILKHHERWDGKGYPLGLAGRDIPVECRILAIAEAYDVMTTETPYSSPMSTEDALAEIARCAGTQFDPEMAGTFVAAMRAL